MTSLGCSEKTYPYPVAVYKAKEEMILRGKFKFEQGIEKIKKIGFSLTNP